MAVSIKQTSDVAAVITVSVKGADYQAQVEKEIKNYQKKATLPGFRKGHAPLGLIKKQVGESIKVDEINRYVVKELFGYIDEQKLQILGQPLPVVADYDFATQEDFDFAYDVALAPSIDVQLSKEDKLTYYNIAATKEMEDEQIKHMLDNAGTQIDAEEVADNDVVYGRMVELASGAPKEGGIVAEKALILPRFTRNEEQKAKLIGAKLGDVLTLVPYSLYDGQPAELTSLLDIKREDVPALEGVEFSYEINKISRRQPAEMNEASFGEQFATESDFKFARDLRELLLAKAGDVKYDEALLKRIFQANNKEAKEEDIDRDMPQVLKDITFDRIKGDLLKAHNVKIEDADLEKLALIVAKNQFAMYGMTSVPDDLLASYAKNMLQDERTKENLIDRVADSKLAEIAKSVISVEEKTVTPEEFNALVNGAKA